MTRLCCWAVLGCIVLVAGARPESPPSVDQLIERLGSRDFKTREAAAKSLSARGEESLPAMRKAVSNPDP